MYLGIEGHSLNKGALESVADGFMSIGKAAFGGRKVEIISETQTRVIEKDSIFVHNGQNCLGSSIICIPIALVIFTLAIITTLIGSLLKKVALNYDSRALAYNQLATNILLKGEAEAEKENLKVEMRKIDKNLDLFISTYQPNFRTSGKESFGSLGDSLGRLVGAEYYDRHNLSRTMGDLGESLGKLSESAEKAEFRRSASEFAHTGIEPEDLKPTASTKIKLQEFAEKFQKLNKKMEFIDAKIARHVKGIQDNFWSA